MKKARPVRAAYSSWPVAGGAYEVSKIFARVYGLQYGARRFSGYTVRHWLPRYIRATAGNGGRSLQKRANLEGHSPRSVHEHDGFFFRIARVELHRLSRRGKCQQLDAIRRR